MKSFYTLKNPVQYETYIKKSQFIGHLQPVTNEKEALAFVEKIKKLHKGANHNVYAWRIGEGGNIQKCSDDGEPAGTAGKPVLQVLNMRNITNIAVVVTRYFGGIKLGAGGLIRAYSQVVSEALKKSEIVNVKSYWEGKIKCDYKNLTNLKNILEKNSCITHNINYSFPVEISFLIPFDKKEVLKKQVQELFSGNISILIKGQTWAGK